MTARETTKRLVSAAKQARALQAVLDSISAALSDSRPRRNMHEEEQGRITVTAGPWAAKNTIVRDVLNELTNATRVAKHVQLSGSNAQRLSKQDARKAGLSAAAQSPNRKLQE